jgi:hypothetical protein
VNESSNKTSGRYARTSIRHGRHLRHLHRRLHRLNHGLGADQDVTCRDRGGRTFSHPRGLGGTRRSGGFARRGHHDRAGRGCNRGAVHELHKALADVARTGDEQLRGEAAQIVTEAASRLNGLMAADRGHLA